MKPWVIPEDVLTGCETSSLDLVTQRLNVPQQQQQSVPQRLKSAPGCVVTNSTFSYSLPILPCSQFNGTRLWRCRITGALFQVLYASSPDFAFSMGGMSGGFRRSWQCFFYHLKSAAHHPHCTQCERVLLPPESPDGLPKSIWGHLPSIPYPEINLVWDPWVLSQ